MSYTGSKNGKEKGEAANRERFSFVDNDGWKDFDKRN